MDQVVALLKDNWAVIQPAIWQFITLALLALGVGVAWGRNGVATQVANKQGQLDLANDRIADYERKLSGASPDEAAKQFAELRAELKALKAIQPWTFSEAQLAAIADKVAPGKPAGIRIVRDVGSARLETAQSQLVVLFSAVGWTVQHWPSMGKPKEPHQTITLKFSQDVNHATVQMLRDAFTAANIPFGEEDEKTNDGTPMIWVSAARLARQA